jgi:hypothetical protein
LLALLALVGGNATGLGTVLRHRHAMTICSDTE